jgi:hypothetical protein
VRSDEGLLSRLDDWFNPIVVKELRQAVSGKLVSAVLLLLLSVQIVALGIYLVASGDFSNKFSAGREAFMILHAIMLAISLFFVPAYTGIRLASERSDTNVDLLFITTIRPVAIVGGKLFSALIITILIFSACMPFMAFTYWLRGIDLPSIFVLLALSFLVVSATIQFTTFAACIPVGRVFKILLGLIVLGTFPQIFVATLTGSFALLEEGIGSRLGSWDFWAPASAVLIIALAVNGILFSMSVALITPAAANRALPIRAFITCIWLLSGAAGLVLAYFLNDITPVWVWGIMSTIVFSLAMFASVSERDTLGPRVRRAIPAGIPRRIAAFLFFSGAASGAIWCTALAAATFAMAAASPAILPLTLSGTSELQRWIGGIFLYGFAYAMTAVFLRKALLGRWIPQKFNWAIATLLLAAGCTLPFLLTFFLSLDSWDYDEYGGWLVGNPFLVGTDRFGTAYLTFAGVWALVAALVNLPWLARQIREFKPRTQSTLARGEQPSG